MMECERILEVEEMVLGRAAHAELRRHLAICDDCQEAEAMFREEIGLFAARRTLPRRRGTVHPRRWAALAVAAGLAIVGSALRTEERADPTVLACTMPALPGMGLSHGGEVACMPRGGSLLLTRAPISSFEKVSSSTER